MATPPKSPALRLVTYVVCTLLLAAALAPILLAAGRGIAGLIEGIPALGRLHEILVTSSFHRYFNRSVLVAALVLIPVFGKALGIRKADFAANARPGWPRDLSIGFLLGAGFILALGTILVQLGHYSWQPAEKIRLGSTLWRATSTGVGVALIEEFFFRGALFALLLRSMRQTSALWTLSIIFAIVHFLKPPGSAHLAHEEVTFTSGFWLLGQILGHFGSLDFLLAEFATLLAAGLVLGWARLRTGGLWLPIGIHGGWVFGISLFRGIAKGSKEVRAGDHLPWIGENLRTGLYPLIAIALTYGLIALYLRTQKNRFAPTHTPSE